MHVVSLGFRCNNACVFCAQGELRARDTDQSAEVLARILAAVPDDVIAFVGGEPTLHQRLPEWIREAETRGPRRILVQTNGRRLAYRSYARELGATSSRLALDVSLQGSTAAMHDYHTQVPGSWTQTLTGLRNAREEGIPTATTTVVTRSNVRHLTEIVQLAHAVGAKAVHLTIAERFGRAASDWSRVAPNLELAQPLMARAAAEARRLGLEMCSSSAPSDRFAGIGEVQASVPLAPPDRVGRARPLQSLKEVAG